MSVSDEEGVIRRGPFVKGDPRINRKGRPKSFDALRALAKEIAHEVAKDDDGQDVVIDGHRVTIAESILRRWATSKEPKLNQAFLEIAFGKVPNRVEMSGQLDVETSGRFTVEQRIEKIVAIFNAARDRESNKSAQ